MTRLYFCQLTLETGNLSDCHPGNQADEMKEVEFVPLLGVDTGWIGGTSP